MATKKQGKTKKGSAPTRASTKKSVRSARSSATASSSSKSSAVAAYTKRVTVMAALFTLLSLVFVGMAYYYYLT